MTEIDNVALIPARGGSKGVLRKNIKPLGGKPLIAWTIEAALEAQSVQRVFVTTEDDEIATVARQYGATVLPRPKPLAMDHVQTGEVFLYALRQLQYEHDIHPIALTLLQPTSPFRTGLHIDQAHDLLDPSEGCVVSVFRSPKFYWASLPDDGFVPIMQDPRFRVGRQWRDENDMLLIENGALYLVGAETFAQHGIYRVPPYTPYYMDAEHSLDIDSPEDFDAAEKYLPRFLT